MTYPLISVIIPAYKHAAYIGRALQSVYDQTWPDIELILLDDCSTDNTLECAHNWLEQNRANERFSRIVIEKNPRNLGAHATINRGLSMSRGRWLTILNSDDWYAPTRFSKLFEAASNASWVFSRVAIVDENDQIIRNNSLVTQCRVLPERIRSSFSIGHLFLAGNIAISTGNIFFTRELYEKVGEFSPLKLAHDWDYMLRCLAYGEPVFVNEDLYFYRMHSNNSFRKLIQENYLEPQIILRRYFSIIQQVNYTNPLFPLYQSFGNMKWFRDLSPFIAGQMPDYNRITNYISCELKKNE